MKTTPPETVASSGHDGDHPLGARAVRIGGMGRLELLAEIQRKGVEVNQAGLDLFADSRFTTSAVGSVVDIVEVTVAGLGFSQGATIDKIRERAMQLGMSPCPLELGPHLRLQHPDQPEGHLGYPPSQHRAPPGSLTIVSPPLAADEDIPKGFYLRRIDGVLWLRGYRSGPDHVWSAEDHLVFRVSL
jgi:hypothetical protein